MRRIALIPLLLVAGCGGGAPSSVVPADATVYVGVRASEAERLLGSTSRADVEFARDVEPWLGARAAYFATTADEFGLVFDADDEDAAETFAGKVTAAGPLRASGIVDGRLVLASSRELLRAVNAAAGGEALADSTGLDVAGEDEKDAPDVLLATREAGALGEGMRAFELDTVELPEPVGGPLTARVWGGTTEITGLPPQDPPALDDVPGAAWLALASADVSTGSPLDPGIDALASIRRWPRLGLEGFFEHLGAGVFYIQGRSRLDSGARLVADTADEAKLRRAVVQFARGIPRRHWNVDLNLGDDFLQLLVARRNRLGPHFFLQVENGRMALDLGEQTGGVAEDLDRTPRYQDAQRRLRGAPTLLIEDEDGGYTAAYRAGGTLRVVRRAG